MSKTNLLEETIEIIESEGKNVDDVIWVGDNHIYFTWDEFVEIAKDFNYNPGFGGNEVVNELMVVGSNWWLTRGEYDGSEWWDFHTHPLKPGEHIKPKHLKEGSWSSTLKHPSDILLCNFDSDEELKSYIRENNISKLIDNKESK